MSLMLLIETATAVCSVGIARNGEILALRESHEQRSHAEMITVLISDCMQEAAVSFDELDALAVSKGPGSYTGLRIGVSTAKGICFAKDIPLIAIDTLEAMAHGFQQHTSYTASAADLLIPMIDARRMEVYAAVFSQTLQRIEPTTAKIIDEHHFSDYTAHHQLWLFGDGASKCSSVLGQNPAIHIVGDFYPSTAFMAMLAHHAFLAQRFEDVAYFEPFYLKDFVAGIPKVKGLH